MSLDSNLIQSFITHLFIWQIPLSGATMHWFRSEHWRHAMEQDRHEACPDGVYVSKGDKLTAS